MISTLMSLEIKKKGRYSNLNFFQNILNDLWNLASTFSYRNCKKNYIKTHNK